MRTICTLLLAAVLAGVETSGQSPATPLRIVVVQGEDGVNIIQQKTAVRPIVEVRDRNNLPVSGAIVTFSIEGGTASFGGASTLTVATNAAGQAAVSSLTPSAAGAFQIQVSAAFQGQVATATIAQTNVMTAAQAAAAGAASGGTSGSSAGSSGGAAGGGGGLSGTTLAVAGAAVAGGALAAVKVAENVDADEIFTGTVSGQTFFTSVNRTNGLRCTTTRMFTGTVHFEIDDPRGDRVEGHMEINGTERFVSSTCTGGDTSDQPRQYGVLFSGTDSSIRGREQHLFTGTAPNGHAVQNTLITTFEGARSGDTIVGTFSFDSQGTSTSPDGVIFDTSSSASFPMTLTKTQ
ncbi:MAG TPA: hypothetical protein VEC39_10110 [Vicinamibacterales bacterium]|nr:hypothetical protein [Vicinamibacterales bacterium]